MTKSKLYAWTRPAYSKRGRLDHTWVTSYDNRVARLKDIENVIRAGENFWYCWGAFHSLGGTPAIKDGLLVAKVGDVGRAKCHVLENANSREHPRARGAIFHYGVHGVCHQLANEVLYATGPEPATVRGARGYHFGIALFSTYGTQLAAWSDDVKRCSKCEGANMSEEIDRLAHEDEFAIHLRATLMGANAADQTRILLSRRHELMACLQVFAVQNPSADELNEIYTSFFRDAAVILGPANFWAVFGEEPSDEMEIVDPAIHQKAHGN